MLFNTPLFFWFFATFFVLYSFVVLRHAPRVLLILVSSLMFYAGWNYRFIPLLLFSGMVDHAVGLALDRTREPVRRRWLLVVSVVTNLGILATFKYADFALESVADLLTLCQRIPEMTPQVADLLTWSRRSGVAAMRDFPSFLVHQFEPALRFRQG